MIITVFTEHRGSHGADLLHPRPGPAGAYVPDVAGEVLLLDVYSLFFRAYFALPHMSTRRGEPTSGLYGFAALLLKLLREERPAGAAFALDDPTPTFRHLAYPAYKEGRADAAAEAGEQRTLGVQLGRLGELLDAFGFPALVSPGFEADDVLATLAREIGGAGERPLVVTGDRDCLQLARPPVEVLEVSRGGAKAVRYDAAAVERRTGVPPHRFPDYQALVGDPSDNLPGVPGVGPRTAAQLLGRFGGLPALLAHLDQVEPPRLRAQLVAHAGRLPLWLDLARLRDDVPLPPGPRFAPLGAQARERIADLFERLEFRSLAPRLSALPASPE